MCNCNSFRFILVVIFAAVVAGCAGSQKATRSTKTQPRQANQLEGMDESFDPLTLNDYNIKLEIKKSSTTVESSSIAVAQDSTINNETEMVDGYRVQILAIAEETAAREMRKEAILKQDRDVYLEFKNPYYKVRVGDCISRADAEKLQQDLVEKGFLDAWVIRTKVFKKKARQTVNE